MSMGSVWVVVILVVLVLPAVFAQDSEDGITMSQAACRQPNEKATP